MTINKEAEILDMPWEKGYGYAQAGKVEDTIFEHSPMGCF